MRVNAPAKINLHLRVGPPTPDGFHPLLTWMVTVGLFDNLEFTLTDTPERPPGFLIPSRTQHKRAASPPATDPRWVRLAKRPVPCDPTARCDGGVQNRGSTA